MIDLSAAHGSGERAEPDVDGFLRLFMVPGMAHCAGGPGFTDFDAPPALQAWVERGEAPAALIASREPPAGPAGRRPVCAYPRYARYTGRGSPDEPGAFQCTRSAAAH